MKRIPLIAALASLALALSGCAAAGSSSLPDGGGASDTASAADATSGPLPTDPGAVTIGAADFPENEILANIYADALRAKGVKVTLHTGVGERPAYLSALKDGSIGAIPEYSGSILDYLDTAATPKSPEDVYTALQGVVAKNGFAVGAYSPAQDADTITVTKETAAKYHLESIGDLAPIASKLKLGAPAPFQTVPYGVPALKSEYGVTFSQFVPLAASGSITQTALAHGTVDAADIFSTDPSIEKNGFVSLKDPKNIFAAQNVVPLFRRDVLTQPMLDAADAVSAKLTTQVLGELLGKAAAGASATDVASSWVAQNGLA